MDHAPRSDAASVSTETPPGVQRTTAGVRLQRAIGRLVRLRPAPVVAVLVLVHITLALLTFEPRPHTGGDNAAYITLATSLLERGAYVELWDPAEPPHTKYPPVFPIVLAIALALGLKPWVQLKLVVLGLSATAVAFSFLWLRARRRPGVALAVGTILAVAPGVLREGRWVLSDVPFWAFTMVAIWAFERLRPDDWKRFAVAAAATLLAYFTRSAGLPLVVAALAWLAWRQHWRQFGVLAALIGLPAVGWWLRGRAFATAGYVSEFWLVEPYQPDLGTIGLADLLARIVENVQKYVSLHLPTLIDDGAAVLAMPMGAVIFVLALAGWVLRVRRARVADLFLPLYLGLIFIWPAVWSGERLLLPALPILLFYAAESLLRTVRRIMPRIAFPAAGAAAFLLLVLTLPGLADGVEVGRECTSRYRAGDRYPCLTPLWADFFIEAEMAGMALPDHAVVLNRKPRLFHLLSGMKGRNYPLTDDPAALFAVADSAGARYVVFDRLDGLSGLYLRPVLVHSAASFCVMTVSRRTGIALFGLLPGADTIVTEAGVRDGSIRFPPCAADYWRSDEAMRFFGRP